MYPSRATGLPPLTVNQWFPIYNISPLIKLAIIVWIIDLLESTCIARELAMRNGYKLNVTQEIVGLGISNFSGAMTNCYSTTGSFSCSAVNNDSGAKTPLANLFCGLLVGFVLLVLCPVFERIPMNVLGAIIIIGCAGGQRLAGLLAVLARLSRVSAHLPQLMAESHGVIY